MKSKIDNTISLWVSISQSNGRSLGRLFCLPFAGGGATAYHRWIGGILAGIDVARVKLPGRENRLGEPLFTDLPSLVDTLVEELILWLEERPFALYGHSMGALLAFELAREIRRRHRMLPVHLFVSGCQAPQLLPSEPPCSHLPDADFIDRSLAKLLASGKLKRTLGAQPKRFKRRNHGG